VILHLPVRARYSFAGFLALLLLAAVPTRAKSQHTGHAGIAGMPADTLATAPTKPTRPVSDSAKVADSLLTLCKPHVSHSIDAYSTCIGDGIASLSSAGNIAVAMGTLDYVIHSDPSLVLLGHPLAHALGYAVRSTPATATRLLSQCDDRYQSGCYHGILQRYFDARIGMPIAQTVLLAPCDGLRGTREQFRLFDCLHGTGHGLMMYHRYDVNASLKDCDRLTADWDQRSCYSGVFMEHNMGARMQTFGDGAFGMHRHSTPAASVVLFKPNDLHYPCAARTTARRARCATPLELRTWCASVTWDWAGMRRARRRFSTPALESGATLPPQRECRSAIRVRSVTSRTHRASCRAGSRSAGHCPMVRRICAAGLALDCRWADSFPIKRPVSGLVSRNQRPTSQPAWKQPVSCGQRQRRTIQIKGAQYGN